MVVDIDILQDHQYIKGTRHPTLDLWVWNYTPGCQFDRAWDEWTTMCRGLITDSRGNIVARPFPKFFNVGETVGTMIYNLPREVPEVRVKQDGSLGVQHYNSDPNDQTVYIATRGSFMGEQAVWATEWMKDRRRGEFLPEFTYVYEIIYPENQIVINYGGREELVLLAVIHTEDGHELDVDTEGLRLGLDTPQLVTKDIWTLQNDMKSLPGNEEGYVLRFSGGLRVKMKGHEYIRRHKAIMHCSTTAIWELLAAGGSIGIILEDLPDELHEWVRGEVESLGAAHDVLVANAVHTAVVDLPSRREQAEYIIAGAKDISGMVFNLLDSKDINEQAWKLVRPEYRRP